MTGPPGRVRTRVCWRGVSLWVAAQSPSPFGRKPPLSSKSGLCPEKRPCADFLLALWFHGIPSPSRWEPDIRVDEKTLTNNSWERTAQLIRTWLMDSWVEMYSPFSLLVVGMCYKITINTEFANTEPLLQGEIQRIRFLWASDHSFINQSIHNLIICLFLFRNTLFNIVSTTLFNIVTTIYIKLNSSITHAWMKLMQCKYFHHETISQPSCPKNYTALEHYLWRTF